MPYGQTNPEVAQLSNAELVVAFWQNNERGESSQYPDQAVTNEMLSRFEDEYTPEAQELRE